MYRQVVHLNYGAESTQVRTEGGFFGSLRSAGTLWLACESGHPPSPTLLTATQVMSTEVAEKLDIS